MSETEQRLYELLLLAETNQGAVKAMLDGVAAEREALRQERTALAGQVTELQKQLREAVATAVTTSLAGAADGVVDTVESKTGNLEGKVGSLTGRIANAEIAVQQLINWASWRLLGLVVGVLVVLGVFGWLVSAGVQWWDTKTIAQDLNEKDQLQQEIANLQANQASWVQAGMLDKITRCNPGNRPCVAVDETAGQFGPQGGPYDLRVLKGH